MLKSKNISSIITPEKFSINLLYLDSSSNPNFKNKAKVYHIHLKEIKNADKIIKQFVTSIVKLTAEGSFWEKDFPKENQIKELELYEKARREIDFIDFPKLEILKIFSLNKEFLLIFLL